MSGFLCGACFATTNDATEPKCLRDDCPGRENAERAAVFFHAIFKCDHDFQGWRNFEDGSGGEQVCTKCGIGAMADAMRNGD